MQAATGTPPSTRRSGRAEARTVLEQAARVLLGRLDELADHVYTLVRTHEPAYGEVEFPRRELWQEIHRSLGYSVGSLLHPAELRAEARQFSRSLGAGGHERGLPLDAVLHAFRLGGGAVWQRLLGVAARQDPQRMRALVHVAGDVWSFVDEHCTVVAEGYRTAEHAAAARRTDRHHLAEALLHGRTRLVELPYVASGLGLPTDGWYAVAAVTGPDRAVVRAALGAPCSGAGEPGAGVAVGTEPVGAEPAGTEPPGVSGPPSDGAGPHSDAVQRLLWHPAATAGVGPAVRPAVGPAEDEAPGEGAADRPALLVARLSTSSTAPLVQLLHDAVGLSEPLRVRVGVSSPVEGLAAVARAVRLAGIALRCCTAEGELVPLDERLPEALLVTAPELAEALVARALGPVLRLEPTERAALLTTLTAWAACDGSAPRAAARLGCHRNTVLNRLRRYDDLTGLTPGPTRTTDLLLALTALPHTTHARSAEAAVDSTFPWSDARR